MPESSLDHGPTKVVDRLWTHPPGRPQHRDQRARRRVDQIIMSTRRVVDRVLPTAARAPLKAPELGEQAWLIE